MLRYAVLNVPIWIEPVVIASWSLFFLLWASARRGVMRNLKAIKPGSTSVANFFRSYRVFWNFAWTLADNVRFKESHVIPDWEFTGYEHFEAMQTSGGAILLTAHMGSYDLGAHLFAERSGHRIIMVRAPEIDPETHEFEEKHRAEELRVEFNVKASDLALDLLHAIREGGIVAVQGDRVTQGIADLPATLFGKPTQLPWKLHIDDQHVPAGYFGHHYFHPTFLYEFIYDVAGVGILLAVDKYFRIKRPGLFALYVSYYCFGRFFEEMIRIDPAHKFGPLRVNAYVSAVLFVLSTAFFIWWQFIRKGEPRTDRPRATPVVPKGPAMAVPKGRIRSSR